MDWSFITDLGDSAVMVPAALAIAALLLANRAWRSALVWLSLFGAGAVLVVGTKIAYIGWGVGVRQLDFTGISGHAMGAASVLTVAGYFIGSKFSKAGAVAAGALGYCAGVIVGLSRVMLGAHSPSEVLVGCALGGLIALAAIRIIRPRSAIVAAPVAFAVMGLILISTLHGERAPSEQLTTKAALYLSGRSAPYTAETH